MLILAGVTISALSGDNGILQNAARAKEETEQAEKDEKEKLGDMEDTINEYVTGIIVEQVTDENPGVLEAEGTDTYVINSIEDLVFLAYDVREGNTYEGKTVKLGLSLDFNSNKSYLDPSSTDYGEYGYDGELLTTNQGWIPIGNIVDRDNQNFEGTFEGNNKVIKNLYMVQSIQERSDIGLFASNKGIIQNLKVLNVQIEVNVKDDTYTCIGSICGNNQGNFINCETSGKVSMEANYGLMSGITGRNPGEIEQCRNYTNLYGKTMYVGGIAAQNLGKIESCVNSGEIIEEAYGIYTGGITGLSTSTSGILSSYNTGNIYVTTERNISVGGIAGQSQSPIIACYNIGSINVEANNASINMGGIVGYFNNALKNSYNLGSISLKGTAEGKIGGIVGNFSQGSVQYCYNEGTIVENESSNIGGIIGYISDNARIIAISNNHYFNNVEKGIGYVETENADYTTLEDNKMTNTELLNLLTTDCDSWKEDTNNINNGYPVLNWQRDPTMKN